MGKKPVSTEPSARPVMKLQGILTCILTIFYALTFLVLFIDFWRERHTHISLLFHLLMQSLVEPATLSRYNLVSVCVLTRDQTATLAYRDDALTNQATQPGPVFLFCFALPINFWQNSFVKSVYPMPSKLR